MNVDQEKTILDVIFRKTALKLAAILSLAGLSANVFAQSPVAYNFTTDGPTFTTGCPSCLFADKPITGSFIYDAQTPLWLITGTGIHVYRGAMTEWNAELDGETFYDALGLAVVGDNIVQGFRDIVSLNPGINLQGFSRGGYDLVDARMQWIQEAPGIPTGVPDFLTSNLLPPDPPQMAGSLRLDFENPSSPGVTFSVHFPNLLVTRAPTAVALDIKPGKTPNSVNPSVMQNIAVAVLTTESFDATQIDPATAKFGPLGIGEAHGRGHVKDVDGDGDADMILHFIAAESGITCGDTEASLIARTFGNEEIAGTDSVNTVPCRR